MHAFAIEILSSDAIMDPSASDGGLLWTCNGTTRNNPRFLFRALHPCDDVFRVQGTLENVLFTIILLHCFFKRFSEISGKAKEIFENWNLISVKYDYEIVVHSMLHYNCKKKKKMPWP